MDEPLAGPGDLAAVPPRIEAIRVGRPTTQAWGGRSLHTGAVKARVEGPVLATAVGLQGDGQGDLRVHGGPDKAICCYPIEHYARWRAEGIELPEGGLFENLTLSGLTEDEVCLGDVWAVGGGGAIVQVTAPRRPCSTIALRWGRPDLPRLVQDRGRCGYYLRVLVEGPLTTYDVVRLDRRDPAPLTVAEVNRVMNVDRTDDDGIARLLASDRLPGPWRQTLHRRRDGELEDDNARLGPG